MRRIAVVALGFMIAWALLPAPARALPIQPFEIGGVYEVDVSFCYGGSGVIPGPSGDAACAGDTLNTLPLDTAVSSAVVVTVPQGSRLVQEHLIFTPTGPGQWQREAAACGALDGNGECTAGASTGSITMRVDLGCSNGPDDILTTGGPGGPLASWPDASLWTPADLVRTAQGTAATGGPNAYATSIVPWSTEAPNAYGFVSTDTTSFSSYAIGGGAPLTIPEPIDVQLSTYTSGYGSQSGLEVSTLLVGGSPRPPVDDFTCFDSPEHLVLSSNTLKTPNADGLVPRWVALTAAPDLREGTRTRILDWECRVVGAGLPDADGDCLADADEPPALSCIGGVNDRDCDNDGVPDGVDDAAGGSVTSGDIDGDGSSDLEEMLQATDPTASDSDGDGQLDRRDIISTNTCSDTTAPVNCTLGAGNQDALEVGDDNCPTQANASQLNSDSMNDYHGKPGGTGDLPAPAAFAHWSNPSEDLWGDACDRDDDNDALADLVENPAATVGGGVTIVGWSTSSTSLCRAAGVGAAPAVAILPLLGDSDNDLVLDGRECQFRSRPDSSARIPADCPATLPVSPVAGCGQPGNFLSTLGCTVAQDPDRDGLCLMRSTGAHATVERWARTTGVNTGVGTQVHDGDGCGSVGDGDIDSDNDTLGGTCVLYPEPASQLPGLFDGDEIMFYFTRPGTIDSDQDGCPDNEEVTDVNGTNNTSSGDQLAMAGKMGNNPDDDGDGNIENPSSVNFDLNKDGAVNAGDQQAMGRTIFSPGNCVAPSANGPGGESPNNITTSTKGLP